MSASSFTQLARRREIMQDEGDVYGDLFLSAAHGQLENVQQLLSSGRVATKISLNISREEFTTQVQGYVKQAVVAILSSVSEQDVTIISVSNSHDIGNAGGTGITTQGCVLVSLNIKAAGGLDAVEMETKMKDNEFLPQVERMLTERIRTVAWQPRFIVLTGGLAVPEPPKAVKYHLDDTDKLGCTAMHWAALNDRRDLIAWLASSNANVSPIGNLVSVAQLLRVGAKVDVQDNWGFTALIRASQNGHLMVVLELLNKGADPLLSDNEQHNCLHWAVYHRHHLVVSWLLKLPAVRGAIDALDLNGASALHLAAKKSGREMCRKLVAAGADVLLTDKAGQPPEKVAKEAKRVVNEQWLVWYRRYPKWLRSASVYRDESGRANVVIPTCLGGAAVVFIALAYIYYALVIFPSPNTDWYFVHACLILHTGPMWWCYFKAWKSDPGTIRPRPEHIVEGIVNQEYSIEDVVMPAMNLKYPRAKYSRHFECYVARFDHDCPWISNVVGLANIGHFIGFCYTVTVCLLCWDVLCIRLLFKDCAAGMIDLCKDRKARHPHLRYHCPSPSDYVTWALMYRKLAIVMICIYVFFVIFTFVMTIAQSSQVIRNITTNEMINWHRYPGWQKEDGSFKNPYDRGVYANLKQFFLGYPSCPRGDNLAKAGEERTSLLRVEGKAGTEGKRFRGNGHEQSCCSHAHGGAHGHSHSHDHKRDDRGGEVAVEMSNLAGGEGPINNNTRLVSRNGKGSSHGDDDDVKRQLRDIGFDDV